MYPIPYPHRKHKGYYNKANSCNDSNQYFRKPFHCLNLICDCLIFGFVYADKVILPLDRRYLLYLLHNVIQFLWVSHIESYIPRISEWFLPRQFPVNIMGCENGVVIIFHLIVTGIQPYNQDLSLLPAVTRSRFQNKLTANL